MVAVELATKIRPLVAKRIAAIHAVFSTAEKPARSRQIKAPPRGFLRAFFKRQM